MKLKHLFVAAVLLFSASATVVAQDMNQFVLPADTAVRSGKLANGLTYYIRHNNYPEHRVNFYIAQRVGSIQENDDQRGLAHFLEHMAFNGSDHFKGNNLIEWLRSIGVEFGSDLNAYTGIDQTVYRVCNVPSTRTSALDSCLLILKDWSNGLTLDPQEIQKERGVIHEEWRLRTSPFMRMFERNLEKLYPNSKYGVRMPIGKMEIVDNFKPIVLRKYYEKWYRPDNQAIIIVGDVDVNRTEAKIKELFSGIKLQPNAAQVTREQVPDNAQPIIIVDKDKEQRTDMAMLMFKHDEFPDSMKNNISYLIYQYATSMATQMLNARFSEKSQEADCPFIAASVSDGDYIFASTKDALDIDFYPKDGKAKEALAAVMREALRAQKFGFTATEYARAKEEYMSQLEKAYTNRNKRKNDIFGDACRDNYLSKEPLTPIEFEYNTMKQVTPAIPVEAINQMMKEMINEKDSNLVLFYAFNEKEGRTYPTEAELLKTLSDVHHENITAYVDNVKNEPLIATLPKAGKIKKTQENAQFGYKTITLSNGVKVILKKTDYKDDEVQMAATAKGGKSLLGNSDIANTKFFDYVIMSSGLGNFSSTELEKALAGKQASVNMSLTNLSTFISGKSTPKDLETLLQLTYLKFTDIKKDEKSYASLMNMLENQLKNKSISPDAAMSDSLHMTLNNHNPRFASMDISDLKNVNYDRILQIAKENTANAANYTFYFVGNFDEAKLLPLIEQYIGSLPASKKKSNWKKIHTYAQGQVENKFLREMETPKANAYMLWYNNKAPYTLENDVLADATGQILSMIYLKEIREEASAAYSAGAYGYATLGSDVPFTCITGVCPMKPEKADLALKIMNEEMVKMETTVDADMLDKVKKLMLKRVDENLKTNDYWMDVITDYDLYGVDKMTNCKNIINSLTPAKIAAFVKNVILTGNSVKVIMLPKTEKK